MSRSKDMIQHGCLDPDNKVYLFIESYENIQNREILVNELRALRLREMCGRNGEKPLSESGDPILHYILGYAKMPSLETLLDFCWKNAQSRSDLTVFLDICYFLNQADRARQLSDVLQLDHDLIPKIGGSNNLLDNADNRCSYKWIRCMKDNQANGGTNDQYAKIDAELFSLLLHFVYGDPYTAVCEMAARGYVWDAFILMSFISPQHQLVAVLKTSLWKKYDLDWINEVISGPISGTFESLSKLGLNSEIIFRVLMKTFEAAGKDELAKRTADCHLHVCLLSAIIEATDDRFANKMMDRYFVLVCRGYMDYYLSPLQKTCFKKAFVVMSDTINSIVRMCGSRGKDSASSSKDDYSCILSNFWRRWIDQGTMPPNPSSADVCMGISDILNLFTDDLLSINNMFIGGVDYKSHVLLALRIAEVLFKKTLINNHCHEIYELLCKCHMSEAHLEMLLRRSGVRKPLNNSVADFSLASIDQCFHLVERLIAKEKYYSALEAQFNNINPPTIASVVSSPSVLESAPKPLENTAGVNVPESVVTVSSSAERVKSHDSSYLSTFCDVPTDLNFIGTPHSNEKDVQSCALSPDSAKDDISESANFALFTANLGISMIPSAYR